MAFGYKVPNFNLWARIYKVNCETSDAADRFYLPPRYTRCSIAKDINLFSMHVLFPKYTYLRSDYQTPFSWGDLIQVAGWENCVGKITHVSDIGAGYFNEHRAAIVYWDYDYSWDNVRGQVCASCDPTLEPPEGYEPLPLVLPADFWQVPDVVTEHPPP